MAAKCNRRLSALPAVYPLPREMKLTARDFVIDAETAVLLPDAPSADDRFLTAFLTAELVDRYRLALAPRPVALLPRKGGYVIVGACDNPLVRAACRRRGLKVSATNPGPEGYVLDVDADGVVIAGSDTAGALYGLQSLRQLMAADGGAVRVRGARLRDWPYQPFRGIRIYFPGREDLPFFKRFIRDFASYFKYNKLILEMNAAMRLDRHPELNAGWRELAECMIYTRRDRPAGPGGQFQDSTHHDTGSFGLVEKDDVAAVVAYARRHGIDVIPEIPSLTHAYYLLTRHRELAEITRAEWPDTWCPLVPEAYKLYFDVLEEYIEVMQPSMVHIGHDEWRMPMDVCPRCRGRDYRELMVEDIRRIHGWLAERGIRVAMWGDHLLESVRERGHRDTVTASGYEYRRPAALTPEQVERDIPKDILIFNWFWKSAERWNGPANDRRLSAWGFEQVYGNFGVSITEEDYKTRSRLPGVIGGAPSGWVRTDEYNLGKDLLSSFVGCAGLVWSDQWLAQPVLGETIQAQVPVVRRNLGARTTPTEDGEPVTALDLAAQLSVSADHLGLGALRRGVVAAGPRRFALARAAKGEPVAVAARGRGKTTLPAVSGAIPVGEDVSSLLFLHACAQPAGCCAGHVLIYNFPDCADLLGWYEITYEDGFVDSVPLRYGVNILEWTDARRPCYGADAVNCAARGKPLTFFACEWVNPRMGKAVRSVRLRGSKGYVDARGKRIESNTVALLAMSIVRRRPGPAIVEGTEDV